MSGIPVSTWVLSGVGVVLLPVFVKLIVRRPVVALQPEEALGLLHVRQARGQVLRGALQDGSAGFSTGLGYPPAQGAPEEEIIAVAGVLREFSGAVYATHMRDEGDYVVEVIPPTNGVLTIQDAGTTNDTIDSDVDLAKCELQILAFHDSRGEALENLLDVLTPKHLLHADRCEVFPSGSTNCALEQLQLVQAEKYNGMSITER